MPFTIDRYHDFSAGHRVHGHESKCAHLHGHNYRVTFTCAPAPRRVERRRFFGQDQQTLNAPGLDKLGRVIDFSVVKERLCQWLEDNWDHKMLIWEQDPLAEVLETYDKRGLVVVPFNPTAENMAQHLVEVVAPQQLADTDVALIACRVEETRKCAATYVLGG